MLFCSHTRSSIDPLFSRIDAGHFVEAAEAPVRAHRDGARGCVEAKRAGGATSERASREQQTMAPQGFAQREQVALARVQVFGVEGGGAAGRVHEHVVVLGAGVAQRREQGEEPRVDVGVGAAAARRSGVAGREHGMQHRAQQLGGDLVIQSEPGSGSRVEFSFPTVGQ